MSYGSLLNQTITRYEKTGYGADGRRITASGVDESARVELRQKRRMMPNGSLIIVEGRAFLSADSEMTDDDRFVYDNTEYKVYSVYRVPGANGQIHHVEIEFVKARAS